ncbi:MAG TPA: DUF3103 family protein [Gemmatimonadaceae bacterium]|nr:DUF3103 family protein [Gemmatimonadaceae bacterium]
MYRRRAAIVCAMLGAFGCTADDKVTEPTGAESVDETFKRAAAARLASVLTDASVRGELIAALRERSPLALSELTGLIGEIDAAAGSDVVPEISLREPAGAYDSASLRVAWAPSGDEATWTEIPAYMLGGAPVSLDPQRAPDEPVLVVETRGRLTMLQNIEKANLLLRQAGLQRAPSKTAPLEATNIQTTQLTSIRLANDQEPWISGAAEIYAIVSGVVGSNDPQLMIVDMPYLDHDNTTYYPNQLIVNWSNFQYQVANIQLYEHDDNTSYQDLVIAIVAAVGAAGSLAGYPVVQAITEIANRIIAAMPSSVFTNDDDYVDSFYTIEQTQTYTNLIGAGNNARISIRPFTVVAN